MLIGNKYDLSLSPEEPGKGLQQSRVGEHSWAQLGVEDVKKSMVILWMGQRNPINHQFWMVESLSIFWDKPPFN